jgi:hypothetical protein
VAKSLSGVTFRINSTSIGNAPNEKTVLLQVELTALCDKKDYLDEDGAVHKVLDRLNGITIYTTSNFQGELMNALDVELEEVREGMKHLNKSVEELRLTNLKLGKELQIAKKERDLARAALKATWST